MKRTAEQWQHDIERELQAGVLAAPVEVRSIDRAPTATTRVRQQWADDDEGISGPVIEGYASVSGVTQRVVGFFSEWDEEVAPDAWKKSLSDGGTKRSMFNHNIDRLLGSTDADTARFDEDKTGLFYSVDINIADPNAMSVYAQVERGDVHGASVWFRIVEQSWTYPDESNDLEVPKRTMLQLALYEGGPVVDPVFVDTTATARSALALDGALRAAGMQSRALRAKTTADLLAHPADVEDQLRKWFDEHPETRATVCACNTGNRQTAGTPASDSQAAGETPAPDQYRHAARALEMGMAMRT